MISKLLEHRFSCVGQISATFFYPVPIGDEFLVEYQIREVLAEDNGNMTSTSLRITVILRRRMEYHVFNTFLHVTILLLIGMLSLFFHTDNFSDRIMVTLTTLLVLVTLMSSIQGVS